MKRLALCVLWPAFLTAGALDALVFAVLDPHEMRWFGGTLVGWTPVAVYSATFLIFWAGVAASAAMTALLSLSDAEVNAFGADPAPASGRSTGAA
jgi:hypothetical protein